MKPLKLPSTVYKAQSSSCQAWVSCKYGWGSVAKNQAWRAKAQRDDSAEHSRSHRPDTDCLDTQNRIKQLVADDPETQIRIERVRKAAALVAGLQAQKAELDRKTTAANYASAWEVQDQERLQAQDAAQRCADVDILRAADSLEEAQQELKAALTEQGKWSSAVDEESERLESAKAGAIAAIGSGLAGLPFVLASNSTAIACIGSIGTVLLTGLLFGVTYRYAVRQDVGNVQLKGGVLAAFGLVRGLAMAEEILKAGGGAASLAPAAAAAGESMLSIGFAAVALEFGFQRGVLKPFSQL